MRTLLYITTLLVACSGHILPAQDIKQEATADLIRIRDVFTAHTSFSMNMHYSFFPEHHSKTPVETHTGYYCKMGEALYLSELYGTTTISNGEVVMVKDDSSKIIMVKKFFKEENPPLTHEQFEKMLKICNSVEKIKGRTEDEKAYSLLFKEKIENLVKMDILFNAKTYNVRKIIMYFDRPIQDHHFANVDANPQYPKPRLEVEYINFNGNSTYTKEKFSVKKYIGKINNKWELTAAYAGKYTLFDQTTVNK